MKSFLIDFKFKKVFDKNNNLLGDIYSLLFDINYEKVVGFVYKKNFLNFSYFFIDDIVNISNEKIIINLNFKKEENYYEIIGKNIKNQNLENIGILEDIEFLENYKLENIIVDCGYNFGSLEIINKTQISIKKDIRKISKKYILEYNKDYILIKDKLFLKENKKTLENISKIFINIPKPIYNLNKK